MWEAIKRALKESTTAEKGNVLGALSLVYALYDAFTRTPRVSQGVIIGIIGGLVIWLGFAGYEFWMQVRFFRWKHVPYFVLIGQSDEHRRNMIDVALTRMRLLGFKESLAMKLFRVERADWLFHRAQLPIGGEREWNALLSELDQHFRSLVARYPSDAIIHLFLNMPLPLGVAFGAKISTRTKLVLHNEHSISQDLKFAAVIDLSSQESLKTHGLHLVKTEVRDEFKYVEREGPENLAPHILVSTNLGSHAGIPDIDKRANKAGLPAIHIKSTFGSTLTTDMDWLRVHREAWTLINKLLDSGAVNRIDLFPISPLPLAVALGMALGTYDNVCVYRFLEKAQDYQLVFRLNSLC